MTQKFDADVKRLLNNILTNIYKDDEIFIRELISNSIDAGAQQIKIFSDGNENIVFTDDGIGMDD